MIRSVTPFAQQLDQEKRLIFVRVFTVFLLCFLFWVLIAQDLNPLSLGVAVGLSIASALYSFGLFYEQHLRPTARIFLRFDLVIVYVAVVLYLSYIAIIDIVRRMLTGDYRPGIVKIRTRLRSPFGRAVLCNTISIVPGTLALWMDGATIYVHWFNIETRHSKKAARMITFLIEDILERIFG